MRFLIHIAQLTLVCTPALAAGPSTLQSGRPLPVDVGPSETHEAATSLPPFPVLAQMFDYDQSARLDMQEHSVEERWSGWAC